MILDFSVGLDPVVDCDLSGWPSDKRLAFQSQARRIAGVEQVAVVDSGMVQVTHRADTEIRHLTSALAELANRLLPGRCFSTEIF